MAFVVLAIGRPALSLFGTGFEEGYPLLFVLVVSVVLRAAVGPAESLLTMSGHQKLCAAIYGTALTVNIGLNMALIPEIGLWGAAAATAIAVLTEAACLAIAVWFRLGIAMAIFVPRPRPAGIQSTPDQTRRN